MKLNPFFLILLLLLASRLPGRAQDDTIHIVTSMNKDGTRTVMQTNSTDRTAETSIYDVANKLLQKTIFTVDDSGQTTGGSVYAARGTNVKTGAPIMVLVYKMVYKRDSMNRLGEVDNYSPAGQLLSRQIYHYNAANQIIKVDNFDAAGNAISADGNPSRPDKDSRRP